ncbi:MAG: N-acyl amino acid synthase FeeM domain-containing protein [Bacteroidota bacterium]
MDQSTYTFRQPNSISELRALLELRYRVYRESRLQNFIADNPLGLDLDCYDLKSMHFGLFRCVYGMEIPVGYMRLVTDRVQSSAYDIMSISSADGTVLENVLQTPDAPFPVMTYAPAVDRVNEMYHELLNKGESIVEPGRFALDESARGRLIAKQMVAATFAVTIANGIDSAILSCTLLHSRTYKQFGFNNFPGTEEFYCDQAGENALLLLLLGVRASLPESERGKVMKMAKAYAETGCIFLDPSQPNQFTQPIRESNPVHELIAA